MRRRTFALVAGSNFRHLCCKDMQKKVLSVFVDESGKFQYPDSVSRFYIVSLGVWGQPPREVMVFDGCGLFSAN